MDIIVTRKLLFIDQHVMSEILNTNKDIMTDMGIISRNEVNKELLLKKKEVPETIKKERAQYEILGITNVLIDENLKSVSFDYNDASFDYECKGGMDTITVTKKDGTDYTFEFLNSLFVKNLEEHTSQKIETHNKNLFTRLNFCLNAQDKISKEIPE